MAPRQSVMPAPVPAILGHLELIARKTGAKLNGFPIDAERVTFGRGEDCDVRIYVPDISKLHAEIEFDLETGQAALTVHGSNGVVHTPADGKPTKHKTGAIVVLGDGDQLLFAKKLFRFTYGSGETQQPGWSTPVSSPAKLPRSPGLREELAGGTPVRRRASHRLSIVPEGRRFVPLPPRKSTLGLEMPVTPNEEEEEPVKLAGDEGDTLFVEKREHEEPKLLTGAFMTPQAKRKLEPRNTSAVPRTRTLRTRDSVGPAECLQAKLDVLAAAEPDTRELGPNEQPPSLDALEDAEEPEPERRAESPRTPKYIPLPPPSDTPYATPSKQVQLQITAQVAYSTPRGDASLRKLLLLRSARKVWEESQLQRGVDGGIALGSVETRRKSFGRASSRKSSPPKPVLPDSDSSEEEEENDENAPPAEETPTKITTAAVEKNASPSPAKNGELKWIFEDGQASFEDSDSDGGSLSSDTSIPGQGVIDFGDLGQSDGEEEGEEDEGAFEWDDHVEDDEAEEDESDMELTGVNYDDAFDEDSDADISGDVDDAVPQKTSPGTEPVELTPPKQKYTPQRSPRGPRISETGLVAIGGPAVRFEPAEPARPVTTGLLTPSRRGLGHPVREMGPDEGEALLWSPAPNQPTFVVPEVKSNLPDFLMDDDDMPDMTPLKATSMYKASTPRQARKSMPRTPEPVKTTPSHGLTPAQRAALGTPRRLGLPEGSFAHAQPSTPHATPLKPQHPALASSPDQQRLLAPGTPMEDIKRRLSALALKTATPAKDRRKTLDFAVPSGAPSERRKTLALAVPSTPVGGTARKKRLSNIFDAIEESSPTVKTTLASPQEQGTVGADSLADAEEEPEPVSPVPVRRTPRSTPRLSVQAQSKSTPSRGDMYDAAAAEADEAESTPVSSAKKTRTKKRPSNAHLLTPDLRGVKELYPQKADAATPALNGVRELYREQKDAATPALNGVRELYRAQNETATPALDGVKHMYARPQATPVLSGVKELYAVPKVLETPALSGVKELYAVPKVQATPDMDSRGMYPDLPTPVAPKEAREQETPDLAGIKQLYPKLPAATPAMNGFREMYAEPREQLTPTLSGIREMYRQPKTAETPALEGVKHLYARQQPTPALSGVREMYAEPRPQATPALNGIKEMYAQPREQETPALDGVKHLYAPQQRTPRLAGMKEMFAEKRRAEPRVSVGDFFPEIPEPAPSTVTFEPEPSGSLTAEPQPDAAEHTDAEESAQEAEESPAEPTGATLSSSTSSARSRLPRSKSTRRVTPSSTTEGPEPQAEEPSRPTRSTRAASKAPSSTVSTTSTSTRRSTRATSRGASEVPAPATRSRDPPSRRSTRSVSAAPSEAAKPAPEPSKPAAEPSKPAAEPSTSKPTAEACTSKPTAEPNSKVVRRTRSRQVLGEAEQPKAPTPPPELPSEPKSRSTRSKPAIARLPPSQRKAAEGESKSTRTSSRSTRAKTEEKAEEKVSGIRKPSIRTVRKENEAPAGTVAARTRSRK